VETLIDNSSVAGVCRDHHWIADRDALVVVVPCVGDSRMHILGLHSILWYWLRQAILAVEGTKAMEERNEAADSPIGEKAIGAGCRPKVYDGISTQ
jgi:hypothetical protein